MTYGYIRVSTGKQTTENQKIEIEDWCKKNNIVIDEWIGETVSGTKMFTKRKLGAELLKEAKKGDVIVCSEISRLGRSLMMIFHILALCMERGIIVMTVKEGYKMGDSIESKVLAFAFGLSAEIERNLISSRTKEGLLRVRMEGRKLGRPRGSGNKSSKFTEIQRATVLSECRQGFSLNSISKRNGISRTVITKWMKQEGLRDSGGYEEEFEWKGRLYTIKELAGIAGTSPAVIDLRLNTCRTMEEVMMSSK